MKKKLFVYIFFFSFPALYGIILFTVGQKGSEDRAEAAGHQENRR